MGKDRLLRCPQRSRFAVLNHSLDLSSPSSCDPQAIRLGKTDEMTETDSMECVLRQVLMDNGLWEEGLAKLRRVDQGSENTCWTIDTRLVIRVSSLDNALETLQREARLKRCIVQTGYGKRKISGITDNADPHTGWALPESWLVGQFSLRGREHAFTVDQRLLGSSLEETEPSPVMEEHLTSLLWCLKDQELIKNAVEAGVPTLAPINLCDLLQQGRNAHRRLTERGQLQGSAETYEIDRSFRCSTFQKLLLITDPREIAQVLGETVLLHGDLKGEHIVLQSQVTGILDWADSKIGPASVDIEGLVIAGGSAMALRIAVATGYAYDVCITGILMARCNTLTRLDNRLNGDDSDSPVLLLRKQVQRAFEFGELQGSFLNYSNGTVHMGISTFETF